MAAFTLPTPQYSTGTPASSNTPADSAGSAMTTTTLGKSSIGSIVDGGAQPQAAPLIALDEIQIDQCGERRHLVAGAQAQFSGRGHPTPGRQHVVDQQQAAVAALHLQYARPVLEVIGHVDHRRRQLALLAHQYETLG